MKKFLLTIFIFILIIFTNNCAYAEVSDNIIESQFNNIDIDNFDRQLKQITTDNEYIQNFNLKQTIDTLVRGENDINFGSMANGIFKVILKELYNQMKIMKNIIFIVCLCALAKNLSSSFQSKAVGELAFYASYVVMIIMLIHSFKIAIDLTSETISNVSTLMDISLPVLSALMITSGNYMNLSMFHPLVIFTGEVMIRLLKDIALPFIFSTAMLETVNHISSTQILSNMSSLIKSCIGWALKGISIVFTMTLTLQKLSVPAVQNVVNKTAKVAIEAIPVVGEVMAGTVDTISSWTGLIKNGTVLAVIIFMILLCAIPILKLVALILIYKLTAAIVQPISDTRIVKCIDGISESCQLLLGALVCTMIMFIFVAMIGISITTG